MARALDPATQAALDAGAIADRGMILLDLGSGLYGFWTGLGPFTYGGVTYVGAGKLISVDAFEQKSGLEAMAIVGRISAVPDTELTPDTFATIEQEAYHQRPFTISTAYFNAETGALLSVEPEARGRIDQIVHMRSPDGTDVLEMHGETTFIDLARTGYRVRSDVDQRRRNPTDGSLRYVATVATEHVVIGRSEQPPVVPAKKSKKFLGIF
jgi:hypothetical protein